MILQQQDVSESNRELAALLLSPFLNKGVTNAFFQSLVVSLMASFELSFFPLDVLDEIWDLIKSVSEGFLTYS